MPLLKVGDIVTTTRRKHNHLYRVLSVENAVWTAHDAQYGSCDHSDVGNAYTKVAYIQSVFNFELPRKAKVRKVGLSCSTWFISKVEPQDVADLIQNLNQFLADTWP